jgi:hypothetical protein
MLLGPEAFSIDKTLVVAVVAAAIAVAASVARHYFVAIIAALVGGGLVILDRYDVLGRYSDITPLSAGRETVRARRAGEPVEWSKLFVNSVSVPQPGSPANISTLGVLGTNVSNSDIKLGETYFLCGLDGTKLNTQIGRGGARYKINDIGPLPPGALFFVVSDPLGPKNGGISAGEFLKTCPTVSFVAKFNGTTQTVDFDRQAVESALPKP